MEFSQLPGLIDWQKVMAAPRYAGGHEEVMMAIFGSNAEVIANWNEGDYQGAIAYAYRFHDGSIAIMTDYYGSCSGCDSWEDSSDEDARRMVIGLVGNARLCPTLGEAITFCETVYDRAHDYPINAAKNLVDDMKRLLNIEKTVDVERR